VRTVKTASGARAVQIVHSSRRGSRDIEHLGSAHDDAGLEVLKAVGQQRLAAGQGELDLGLEANEVFRQLVLARIIEPTSKLDSLRVLEEVGVEPPLYRTLTRRLRVFATGLVAAEAGRSVRRPLGSRSGESGALRRVDVVFRDRRR
jgi:hypothetical protein